MAKTFSVEKGWMHVAESLVVQISTPQLGNEIHRTIEASGPIKRSCERLTCLLLVVLFPSVFNFDDL